MLISSICKKIVVAGSFLVLMVSFQNCSQSGALGSAESSMAAASSSSSIKSNSVAADDEASFLLDIPSTSDSSSSSTSSPSSGMSATSSGGTTVVNSGTNSQTTTVISTGSSADCPNGVASGPSVSINISSGGTNQQSNNISTKAVVQKSSCASLQVSDLKLALSQIIVRQEGSSVQIASVKGQYLSVDSSISFQALASIEDVDSIVFVLQASGHQYMNASAQVKSMALREAGKKVFSVALAKRTSFVKGQTYSLSLHISDSSSLAEESGKCLLKPVVEIE